MVNTDLRHDAVRTIDYGGVKLDTERLIGLFADLAVEGAQALLQQGVQESEISMRRAIDMRYRGQEHTLTVSLPDGPVSGASLAELRRLFDESHQRRYAHSNPDAPVEFVNIRLEAVGLLEKPGLLSHTSGGGEPQPRTTRTVGFREGRQETPVYDRGALGAGATIAGPAVIEEPGSTSILPPGFTLTVDAARNLIIDIPEGQLV
jgi:N-methylhydantoinase A